MRRWPTTRPRARLSSPPLLRKIVLCWRIRAQIIKKEWINLKLQIHPGLTEALQGRESSGRGRLQHTCSSGPPRRTRTSEGSSKRTERTPGTRFAGRCPTRLKSAAFRDGERSRVKMDSLWTFAPAPSLAIAILYRIRNLGSARLRPRTSGSAITGPRKRTKSSEKKPQCTEPPTGSKSQSAFQEDLEDSAVKDGTMCSTLIL